MLSILINSILFISLISFISYKYIFNIEKLSKFNFIIYNILFLIIMYYIFNIYSGDFNYGDTSNTNFGTFRYVLYEEILKFTVAFLYFSFISFTSINLLKFNIIKNNNDKKLIIYLLLISGLSYSLFESNIFLLKDILSGNNIISNLYFLFQRILYSTFIHIVPFIVSYFYFKKLKLSFFKGLFNIFVFSILIHYLYNYLFNNLEGIYLLIYKLILTIIIVYIYIKIFFLNKYYGNNYKFNLILK